MPSRTERYRHFINTEYIGGLAKGDEYSLEHVTAGFRSWARGGVDRIVFTGMGCSAIVSDVVRGFLADRGAEVEVEVVNDYDFSSLTTETALLDPRTLIVISSYSGYSTEPILAFERLQLVKDRILLLTSGGRLAELGASTGTSTALWQLTRPDREYPLFHVTQYFAILLRIFAELEIVSAAALEADLDALADTLKRRRDHAATLGGELARAAADANVLMIASPRWHDAMLKLCKMHLNEIAMVPASRNLFHEFCHSEVATLSDPERKHLVLSFLDDDADDYTIEKNQRLLDILNDEIPQNRRVHARTLPVNGAGFLEKMFASLDVVQHMTLALAEHREVDSRDLISRAAGNPWYHSATILAEQRHG